MLDWDGSIDFSEFRRLVEDIATIVEGPPPTEAKRKADKNDARRREERNRSARGYWGCLGAKGII